MIGDFKTEARFQIRVAFDELGGKFFHEILLEFY
jgi:hypothetical protein